MADEWFVVRNDRREGPLSSAELKRRALAGDITAADLIWREGLSEPVSCSRVKGLLPTGSPAVHAAAAPRPTVGATPPPLVAPATRQSGSPSCPGCGRSVLAGDAFCTGCGARIAAPSASLTAEDVAVGMLVPHKVTALSVVAGYVGLLSLCVIPAPFALLLGILALRDLRRSPGKLGYSRAIFAIVMGGLGLLLAVVIGVVAVVGQATR